MIDDSGMERRALAAEATVAVLKRKVVQLYNDDQSAIVRQLHAARRRAEDSRRRQETAELRTREAARYSEALEAEVARRTQGIRQILDNVTFGFLVVGRDLVVGPDSTRSCARLFARADVEGSQLPRLLGLTSLQEQHFALAVDQVFEDLLPEEVSLEQVPQKHSTADGRVLRVEGSVIRNAAGEVGAMLFTVSDITALEEATREAQSHRMLVGILKRKEAFCAFLLETQAQLAAARAASASGSAAAARRALHTLKGNAASYGMSAIVELAHRLEEAPEVGPAELDAAEAGLRRFLERNRGVIELDYDRVVEQAYAVTQQQITQFRGLVAQIGAVDGRAGESLQRWSAGVLARPAGQLFGPMPEFVERLAARLGKRVEFRVEREDTIIDVETMRPVLLSLPHLLRNALDHGIEAPPARGTKGPVGHLTVRFADLGDAVSVEVEDDGRGIDVPRLIVGARARGLVEGDDLGQVGVDLIFLDGLSTAESATHTSGRGVGMSAVKAAVEGARGSLRVATERGRGTTFVARVPKPH